MTDYAGFLISGIPHTFLFSITLLDESALSGTPNTKPSPPPPRVSKSSRGVSKSGADSTSSLQIAGFSVDRSPKSVTPKPTLDRPSSKHSTTPDVSLS
ncbi:UNVERIFIED_CONTAM: putative WEB family protein, chloroplastic [Sesamum indicum]